VISRIPIPRIHANTIPITGHRQDRAVTADRVPRRDQYRKRGREPGASTQRVAQGEGHAHHQNHAQGTNPAQPHDLGEANRRAQRAGDDFENALAGEVHAGREYRRHRDQRPQHEPDAQRDRDRVDSAVGHVSIEPRGDQP